MSNIWNVWDKQVNKIESAFNVTSEIHNFLSKVLENYGFSQEFLKWVSIFLQSQELFVINRNKMCHFPLKRGTWQDNPILTCLFVLI